MGRYHLTQSPPGTDTGVTLRLQDGRAVVPIAPDSEPADAEAS